MKGCEKSRQSLLDGIRVVYKAALEFRCGLRGVENGIAAALGDGFVEHFAHESFLFLAFCGVVYQFFCLFGK